MAALTALAIGSLAVGAAGLGLQANAASKASSAAKQQSYIAQQQAQSSAQFTTQEEDINQQSAAAQAAASTASKGFNAAILGGQQDIEAQRNQAMHLQANRQQMEIIRQGQRARSLALATATAQGANKGSGLQGGYGQISGQTGVNTKGVQQNLGIGQNIFDLNAGITTQRLGLNDLQDTLAQQQADLTTQKSKLLQSYALTNAQYQTQYSQYGGQIASAQGQSAIGGALLGAAGPIFNAGMNLSNAFASPQIGPPTDITYNTNGYTPANFGIPPAWGPGTLPAFR